MIQSGARGSVSQMTNMAGMKGLIVNNKGEQVEFPVLTGSKEGHTPIEYFVSTHGSRKGLTDTALNTATAGYLTRKLFDVAQDVIVTYEDNTMTDGSITLTAENLGGLVIPLWKNIEGRYTAATVKNQSGDIIATKNTYLDNKLAHQIEEAGITEVEVYSPLTSKSSNKISQMAYGRDLGTDRPVELGEAVGTIAAQAVGEPGTQLTMRTFHAGGTASQGGDIVQGLPRVIEIFERRNPKSPAVIAHEDGEVIAIEENGYEKVIKVLGESKSSAGDKKSATTSYRVLQYRTPIVEVGQSVTKGQLLTDGSANLKELFKFAGKRATQEYIIHQVRKIYELQGAAISRTHLELIVAQMFSRVKITSPGDTSFTTGELVEVDTFNEVNDEAKELGGEAAKAKEVILGITDVSLSRKSWLSAASFQHTTRILIDAAASGAEDNLHGLKENVILGRLIPAGSGMEGSKKKELIDGIEEEYLDEWEMQQTRTSDFS
jgi:DNA-directed RNA polymerase subunit beta'